MSNEIIVKIIEATLLIVAFVVGRYILPKIPASLKESIVDKANDIYSVIKVVNELSEKFIIYQQKICTASGEEKMNQVVSSVSKILNNYGLYMDDEEIKALAQNAYELIKNNDCMKDNK